MRVIAIFAALLAVAFASPNLEARQQGEACKPPASPRAWSSVVLLPAMSASAVNAATERLSWCGRSLGAPPDERFQQVNTGLHGNEYL
ncbi:hypothetical protein N7489_003113 [Penicillium chrysogenum]|uniref:uncharacterized protein n=1 Tax=Penicillium chrysogenum TaxID=5076 RepID=UPI0024DF2E82|nr:uncharacterized protein N7489_003113 [Penicillium chrysogenum]KAJ5252703.1 hypothetical protein N7489_003113 [Penicillium chrysogenum]